MAGAFQGQLYGASTSKRQMAVNPNHADARFLQAVGGPSKGISRAMTLPTAVAIIGFQLGIALLFLMWICGKDEDDFDPPRNS